MRIIDSDWSTQRNCSSQTISNIYVSVLLIADSVSAKVQQNVGKLDKQREVFVPLLSSFAERFQFQKCEIKAKT